MTYQERKHVREVLMLKTSGYQTECPNGGLCIKDEPVLGVGYTEFYNVRDVVAAYPHLELELLYGY